jgi:iron complex outermembrane receptor protein
MLKLVAARLVLVASGSLLAAQLHAETPSPSKPDDRTDQKTSTALEEITVTGSRVPPISSSAPTPTTVLSADQMQLTLASNVADSLNQMVPSLLGSNTPATSTLSVAQSGSNYLNLRNLGANRTLVLLDGQRFVPTNAAGTVDINVIPQALVDKVEVVTGGASAAWGSDAVAGVVNFITKKNFLGFQAALQGGTSEYGDDQNVRGTFVYGTQFGDARGHLLIAGEAFDSQGIPHQDSRPWGAQGYELISNPAYAPGNGQYAQLVASNVHLSLASEGGLILGGPLNNTQFGPGGVPLPFQPGSSVSALTMIGGDGVNMGKYTGLGTPLQRQDIYVKTSYDLTDSVTASLSASYANTRSSQAVVQPFDLADLTINQDNAFLPASIRAAMSAQNIPSFTMGRVDTDFGFISSVTDTKVARVVGGLEGKIGADWAWDAHYEFGHTVYDFDIDNSLNEANYQMAVDAVFNPTGQVVCRSSLTNPNNGCIPINLFGAGSPSQAALGYVLGTQTLRSSYTENDVAFNLHGTPLSDWAGPIGVAIGVEYRKETADAVADPVSQEGVYLIGNLQSQSGSYDVKEAFTEAVLPLLSNLAFARSAALDLGVREVDYSTSGRETAWKAGLTYDPTEELRFRATRSRDIRAPNLGELFAPSSTSYSSVFDPTTNQTVTIQDISRSNPQLQAEKSNTTTLGVVYGPAWLPGFRASLDYYDIVVNGAVSTLTDQDIVNRCADGTTGLCQFVQRNSAGQITNVILTNINLNTLKSRGFDAELRYLAPLSRFVGSWDGNLEFRLLATYIKSYVIDDGVNSIDVAGDVGDNSSMPTPHLKGTASLTYDLHAWSWYLGGRYVGGGQYDHTLGPFGINDNHVASQFLVDTSLGYAIADRQNHKLQVTAAITNVFNRYPPLDVTSFFVPVATNLSLYDARGREFNLGLRVQF